MLFFLNNGYDLFVEIILHSLLKKVESSTAMCSWRLRYILLNLATLYRIHILLNLILFFQIDAGTIVTTIQKLLVPDSAKQQKK